MATYKLIGSRFLRKYTAKNLSPAYAAALDAQTVVDEFCNVPWELVNPKTSQFAYHTEEVVDKESGRTGLDENVAIRDSLDAALFCAEHSAGMHRAYAQALCLRFTLPDDAVGASLSSLKLKVSSDPYNSGGCRVSAFTNSTGEIPTNCNTVRAGSVHADAQVPRTSQTSSGTTYWYAAQGDVTLTPDSAITLQKYLFVFFGLEDYSITRGNWLEGSATLKNLVEITTSAAVTGWTDGETYDLSAGDASEYAVVAGGVYPDIRDGYSGVDTLQLQRSGEELRSTFVPGGKYGTDGLRTLNAGVFAEWLDVPAEDITMIQEIKMATLSASVATTCEYLVIGGKFSGGTFTEIPGLYFYDLTKKKFVNPCSLNENLAPSAGSSTVVDPDLLTIASIHGGFAAVGTCRTSGYSSTVINSMFFIARDGFTHGSSSYGRLHRSCGIVIPNADSTDTWTLRLSREGSDTTNLLTDLGHGESILAGKQVYGGGNVTDLRIDLVTADNDNIYFFKIEGGSNSFGSKGTLSYTGTLNAIRSVNLSIGQFKPVSCFAISGHISAVGSVTNCINAVIAGVANETNSYSAIRPAWDANITPDTYDNFMVSGGCCSPGETNYNSNIIITGDFVSLNSDISYSKIAIVDSNGSLVAVPHPENDTLAAKWAFLSSNNQLLLHAETPIEQSSQDYYTNLHTSVTDAQSAIGLRTLYAKLFTGSLNNLACDFLQMPDNQRPGALFVVRGDTVTVPIAAETTADVPTWQMTTAKLVVPFAVPTAFRANKIKLDWTALTNVTTGSKLNVWLKRDAFISDNPQIADPAIYDASKESVDGWELVGVINAVGTSTATFELARALDGRVGTLMFTAYINLDELNPSTSMVLPQGVGIANINGVNNTTYNLYTGWKPDITLIG